MTVSECPESLWRGESVRRSYMYACVLCLCVCVCACACVCVCVCVLWEVCEGERLTDLSSEPVAMNREQGLNSAVTEWQRLM